LCDLIGLSANCKTEFLNNYLFSVLVFLIKEHYGTDVFLKRIRENNLKDFLAFKSYKSIRFFGWIAYTRSAYAYKRENCKKFSGTDASYLIRCLALIFGVFRFA
jgi:hypothetical protein